MSPFVPATRASVPVKVALVGPAGSGKTYTALRLARGIVGESGRIALVDTEHGSASLYADEFQFDTLVLEPPFHPKRIADAIAEAAKSGYEAVVVDGISPAWNGPGGVQEIVDQNAKGGNNWSGWAVGTPAHNQLVQAILAAQVHLICTMRSKTAWVLETNDRGKQQPRKIGMEPVQRDGIDYEFSVVGELDLDHRLHVTKSRLRGIEVGAFMAQPDEALGAMLVKASRGDGNPQPEGQTAKPDYPLSLSEVGGLDDEGNLFATEDQVGMLWALTKGDGRKAPERKKIVEDAVAKITKVCESPTSDPKKLPRDLVDSVKLEIEQTIGAVPK